jgi:hypothetical protein
VLVVRQLVVFQGPGAAVTSSKSNARDSGASVVVDDDRSKVGRGELTPFFFFTLQKLWWTRLLSRCPKTAGGRELWLPKEKVRPSCHTHWIKFRILSFFISSADWMDSPQKGERRRMDAMYGRVDPT